MDSFLDIEQILMVITSVLCILIFLKSLYKLRLILSWRVNCWFCNTNFWVKFVKRNSWICPKCDQYNGFTKDGDYNKKLHISIGQEQKNGFVNTRSPPKNGLCKMCNINQQLKVTQLANFIPMSENNYDEEIESYRVHLEKAYRLCTPCNITVKTKLNKEKEKLLDTKLLDKRILERKDIPNDKKYYMINNVLTYCCIFIAGTLLVLVSIECYHMAAKQEHLLKIITNITKIFSDITCRIFFIVKMKMFITFPYLKHLDTYERIDLDRFMNLNWMDHNEAVQKLLGAFVCTLHIIGHVFNINKGYSFLIDLLWTIFVVIATLHKYVIVDELLTSCSKLLCVAIILFMYKRRYKRTFKDIVIQNMTPQKITRPSFKSSFNRVVDEEDISLDTDDDVSLSKFGLHNLTDSSTDPHSPLNNSLLSGRSFTPKNSNIWSKSKHNTTFSVNSIISQNTNCLKNSVSLKPSFNMYQKLVDSDSELDESISSLSISGPKKITSKINPVFAPRKFTASPCFTVPLPMNRSRPLISPSKLGHSTSWVAGGYWGAEGERQIFNVDGSRSSSQSSGFESQTSSNQRNIFSQPSSREESVFMDSEKTLTMQDGFPQFNMTGYNRYNSPSFTPGSTVFPQLQYNSHVQIPQPRHPQQTFVTQNIFNHQEIPNSMFKAPGGSRLIKLPQDTVFMSH